MIKVSYVGQIFGTREVIKDNCDESDWDGVRKPQKGFRGYCLCKCLICGKVAPMSIKSLKRFPPKRCAYCSGIGNRFSETERNTWAVYDDHATVNVVYKGGIATGFVSLCDYELCKERVWRVSQKRNKIYLVSGSKAKNNVVYMHNLILGYAPKGMAVDHIDGNSLNNTRENLRFLTVSENARFTSVRVDNEIGIRGVSLSHKSGRYNVDFIYDNTRYYCTSQKTVEEAVWCRYCFEKRFSMDTLIRNPLFEQYNTLSNERKEELSKYIDKIIEKYKKN